MSEETDPAPIVKKRTVKKVASSDAIVKKLRENLKMEDLIKVREALEERLNQAT